MKILTAPILLAFLANCSESGPVETAEEQNLTQKEKADLKVPGALSCEVQLGKGDVAADACAYASKGDLGACISRITIFPSGSGIGLGVTRRFITETSDAKGSGAATIDGDAIDIQWNEGEDWISLKRTSQGTFSGTFTAEQDFEFNTTCQVTAADALGCVVSSPCKYKSSDNLGYCIAGLSLKQSGSSVDLTLMRGSKSKYQRTVNSEAGDLKGETVDVQFNDGEDWVSLQKQSEKRYEGTLTLEQDFGFQIACQGK